MSIGGHIVAARSGERGAVLVIVAVFAPVAVLLAAFVIDLGNFWWHKRHLQVQADAGALAAALEFQPCSNSNITARAQQYGGVSGSPLYNQQVGGTSAANIHELINSATYYNQPIPVDSSVSTSAPCTAQMVDVKLTETNAPWYFNVFNAVPGMSPVPNINAHARVEIRQKTVGSGFLPIAVNENTPRAAAAYFIDEDTGNQVAPPVRLTDQGANSQGQEVWSNAAAPLAVPINKPHVGVRIALSGDTQNTTCPATSQLVNCFDTSSNTAPLLHIQGWSAQGTGSPTAPLARSVTLQPGTCSDGYFSNTTTNCSFGITAAVDVGSTPNPPGVSVSAVVAGATTALTYNTGGASSGQWTGSAVLPAGTGSNQVDLQVKCDKSVKNAPCSKTTTTALSDVQRSYSAGANSGTIQTAAVLENGVSGADSFRVCETGNPNCTHNLVVGITTTGSLSVTQRFSDPMYTMRFGTGTSASQSGNIRCSPGTNFAARLTSGCSGNWTINPEGPGWSCPDSADPQDCVQTGNGLSTGQLRQGMTARITTPTNGSRYYCANNWVNNNGGAAPLLPHDDSRVVSVFVTSYGSFGGSGNQWYPIQNFAAFYVMGWDGDPCSSDPGPPDGGNGKDQIWGHFISYIDVTDTQGGGSQICTPNGLGECVAILTR